MRLPPALGHLEPLTGLTAPPHQGLAAAVAFAESALGPVVVKHASGPRLPALRREHAVLTALEGAGLPLPESLLYHEDNAAVQPEGWLIMRRLPGAPLLHRLRQPLTPANRHSLLTDLGQQLRQLHDTPAPPDLAREDWLAWMLDLAETHLTLGEGTPDLLRQLHQTQPAPVALTLIHGDLFLDNVLAEGDGLTGFIDWSLGAQGDPRFDLAVALHSLSEADRRAVSDGYGPLPDLDPATVAYFTNLARFF